MKLKNDIFCPCCSKNINSVTSTTDENTFPVEDDVGICFYCASILVYFIDEKCKLNLRKITDEELNDIKNNSPEDFIVIQSTRQEILNYKARLN